MKRPDRCRNELKENGMTYPKSGCEVCDGRALAQCPHENIDGYIHECCDRLAVAMDHIAGFVLHHKGMKETGADKEVDKAIEHLMNAYQILGENWNED